MPQRRRRLRIVLGLVFLLILVVFLLFHSRARGELRNFEWSRFVAAFGEANKAYLVLSVLTIYGTYVVRTWRWQSFSEPAQPLRFARVLSATVVGFSAIMLLGRPGEIVRPMLIARKQSVSVSSMMAIWAVERIFDTLTVVILLAGVLLFSPQALVANSSNAEAVHIVRQAGVIAAIVAGVGAALLAVYRARPERLHGLGRVMHRFLPPRLQANLDGTLHSFEDGLRFLRDARALLTASVLSLGLWLVICFSYWCICQSLGGEMAQLPRTAMIILVFFAMAGSAVQVPGIGGGLQAATFLALTALYHVPLELAASAAILLWVVSFCVVLLAGLPLLLYEGWSFGQLRQMVTSREAEPGTAADPNNVEEGVRTAP